MRNQPYSSNRAKTQNLTITALLTALAILIPVIMPFKIIIGPASYTLASHVPINMAMFRSPLTAVLVNIGATIGFLFAGFPIIVVFRALSQVIYVSIGAWYLKKSHALLVDIKKRSLFNFIINFIHALAEVIVVYILTAVGLNPQADNYIYVLIVLIGFGTLIHGMVDFEFSYQFTRMINKRTRMKFTEYEI